MLKNVTACEGGDEIRCALRKIYTAVPLCSWRGMYWQWNEMVCRIHRDSV